MGKKRKKKNFFTLKENAIFYPNFYTVNPIFQADCYFMMHYKNDNSGLDILSITIKSLI